MSSTGSGLRVPAWKRLGLKLKYAAESPPSTLNPSPASAPPPAVYPEQSKRKREDIDALTTPTKKPKKSPTAQVQAQNITPILSPATAHLRRQKSVAFTPETKTEDGDSIKQLFSAWVAEQKARDPSFGQQNSPAAFQIPEPSQVIEQVDTKLSESERRVKRVKATKPEKKEKSAKLKKSAKPAKAVKSKPAASLDPALDYLRQFHESKASWKFNKVHQSKILKYAFDIKVVPSSHVELLYKYITGLQGGARKQLRDSAFSVKVKDTEEGEAGFPDAMSDTSRKQREYDAAVVEYVATMISLQAPQEMGYEEGVLLGLSDAAMQSRMAKRMRAERILTELAKDPKEEGTESKSDTVEDEESQKRAKLNDGTPQNMRRKRKARTSEIVDISSSDSSDSSDSDSDSEDDSKTARQGGRGANEGSSSSSNSSASSSDEDSSTDSDSDSD